jgi:hypothetical protein
MNIIVRVNGEREVRYVDKSELRFVLEKMGPMNCDVHDFLMQRYDEDYNDELDFDEFWYE